MKKVLFISHDTSRSGAPIVLLFFLRWLKANTNITINTLLYYNGDLRKEFEELGETFVVDELIGEYKVHRRIKRAIFGQFNEQHRIDRAFKKLDKNGYDLIWGNTIITLPWLLKFKESKNYKCLCTVHELPFAISAFFTDDYVTKNLSKVDLIVAGSESVAKNLIHSFQLPTAKVEIVHAFIETNFNLNTSKEDLRAELGISSDTFIIGSVGSPDIRKGLDLIPQLLSKIKELFPDFQFQFIWLGGKKTDPFVRMAKLDAEKLGLQNNLLFIEYSSYPNDYINLYDVFLLASREDPFPLVTITAAYLQKTVVAFEQSGGAQELLKDGTGFLVPYLNLDKIASILHYLSENKQIMKEVGIKARENVIKNYSPSTIPIKLYKLMQKVFESKS